MNQRLFPALILPISITCARSESVHLIDRRYLDELDKTGFFGKLWEHK